MGQLRQLFAIEQRMLNPPASAKPASMSALPLHMTGTVMRCRSSPIPSIGPGGMATSSANSRSRCTTGCQTLLSFCVLPCCWPLHCPGEHAEQLSSIVQSIREFCAWPSSSDDMHKLLWAHHILKHMHYPCYCSQIMLAVHNDRVQHHHTTAFSLSLLTHQCSPPAHS